MRVLELELCYLLPRDDNKSTPLRFINSLTDDVYQTFIAVSNRDNL
jgi:hypothetical protein